MNIKIEVRDVIICALIPGSSKILAIKGNFEIDMVMNPKKLSVD